LRIIRELAFRVRVSLNLTLNSNPNSTLTIKFTLCLDNVCFQGRRLNLETIDLIRIELLRERSR